jgi:hypothetical protein
MMDPVTLIVAALAAGASAGVSNSASSAIQDLYSALRDLTRRRLRRGNGEVGEQTDRVVEEHQVDPIGQHDRLIGMLRAVDAGADEELVAAAQSLMEVVDPAGLRGGKYVLDLRNSTGVQVGDNPTMTINLGTSS